MSVTIKQIAADLNLAISTVSKALRHSHEISSETRIRVFEHASRVGYKPNPYASSLKGKKSGNIAVVVPEVSDSFFSSAIDGIEEITQERGYHVIVYLSHEDIEREKSIVREFTNRRVDGVLMSVAANGVSNEHLHDLIEQKIPVVFFDRTCEEIKTASVLTNDFESGYLAAKHLIERGCRRLLFLSLDTNLAIIRKRMEGYLKAISDHHLDTQFNTVLNCTQSEPGNLESIRQALTTLKPDGIVGSVEKVTMQAYTTCHELGIRIPEEIKVIGFSHLPYAALLNPPLSTITQPAVEMGKTAATILLKALDKRNASLSGETVIIDSVLADRRSSAR